MNSVHEYNAHNHGGQLRQAAKKYGIPLSDWLDLSTGINPNSWPVPPIPTECWQRLPEADDGLMLAAQEYYQCHSILPVAGSQAAIQALPYLFQQSRVLVSSLTYSEHAKCWNNAGHQVGTADPNRFSSEIQNHNIVIVVNPNNPTGELISVDTLLAWHGELAQKNGCLIIDEAFMDCQPHNSLLSSSPPKGLVILRSLGKFFGLAGLRCGFVNAETRLLEHLESNLGPWSLSHASRWIATKALRDTNWQVKTREQLLIQSTLLRETVGQLNSRLAVGCPLFQTLFHEESVGIHEQLASNGIFTRLLDTKNGLRFGIPADDDQRQRLSHQILNIINR